MVSLVSFKLGCACARLGNALRADELIATLGDRSLWITDIHHQHHHEANQPLDCGHGHGQEFSTSVLGFGSESSLSVCHCVSGNLVCVALQSGRVLLWDCSRVRHHAPTPIPLATPKELIRYAPAKHMAITKTSTDSWLLAVATSNGVVCARMTLRSASASLSIVQCLHRAFPMCQVAFSGDGTLLAAASLDAHIGLWGLQGTSQAPPKEIKFLWSGIMKGTRVTSLHFKSSELVDELLISCWDGSVAILQSFHYQRNCWSWKQVLDLSERRSVALPLLPAFLSVWSPNGCFVAMPDGNDAALLLMKLVVDAPEGDDQDQVVVERFRLEGAIQGLTNFSCDKLAVFDSSQRISLLHWPALCTRSAKEISQTPFASGFTSMITKGPEAFAHSFQHLLCSASPLRLLCRWSDAREPEKILCPFISCSSVYRDANAHQWCIGSTTLAVSKHNTCYIYRSGEAWQAVSHRSQVKQISFVGADDRFLIALCHHKPGRIVHIWRRSEGSWTHCCSQHALAVVGFDIFADHTHDMIRFALVRQEHAGNLICVLGSADLDGKLSVSGELQVLLPPPSDGGRWKIHSYQYPLLYSHQSTRDGNIIYWCISDPFAEASRLVRSAVRPIPTLSKEFMEFALPPALEEKFRLISLN